MEKKVLLIADDDEMSRMIICKFLKSEYEIIEAEDGQQAMEILEARHIDVMLLDIIMPRMDGLEVLKAVRQQKKLDHVGVLVATSTKEKTEREALSLGADDIVSKPYDPVVIKKRLTNIMAAKELNEYFQLKTSENDRAILEKQLLDIQRKINISAEQIQQCVRVISTNKENISLLTEMLSQIEACTDRLEKITEQEG